MAVTTDKAQEVVDIYNRFDSGVMGAAEAITAICNLTGAARNKAAAVLDAGLALAEHHMSRLSQTAWNEALKAVTK